MKNDIFCNFSDSKYIHTDKHRKESLMKEFTGYRKGVNFGGWLSQCDNKKSTYDSFIIEKDFENVKKLGYDHIRLPVDYNLIEDENGKFVEDGFSYIQFAIDMCRKNELNLILDLHKIPGFSFDPFHKEKGLFESEELQNHFYDIWEEFAKRFAKNSDMLCFELLNEVTNKEYQCVWNKMISSTISLIRKYSSDIKIIVGGYYNNSLEAVRALEPPVDENIVYTFHCYEPLLFTHQGAYWIATMDTEFRCPFEMTYAEYEELSKKYLCQAYASFAAFKQDEIISEKYFELLFEDAIKVAEERNVCLYCGEFGVIDRVSKEEAEKWYKLFYKIMDKYSIGSAIWNYKGLDFGIINK